MAEEHETYEELPEEVREEFTNTSEEFAQRSADLQDAIASGDQREIQQAEQKLDISIENLSEALGKIGNAPIPEGTLKDLFQSDLTTVENLAKLPGGERQAALYKNTMIKVGEFAGERFNKLSKEEQNTVKNNVTKTEITKPDGTKMTTYEFVDLDEPTTRKLIEKVTEDFEEKTGKEGDGKKWAKRLAKLLALFVAGFLFWEYVADPILCHLAEEQSGCVVTDPNTGKPASCPQCYMSTCSQTDRYKTLCGSCNSAKPQNPQCCQGSKDYPDAYPYCVSALDALTDIIDSLVNFASNPLDFLKQIGIWLGVITAAFLGVALLYVIVRAIFIKMTR